MASKTAEVIVWFEALGRADVALVGGKNASLGEMVRNLGDRGVAVPPGFATTSQAYWHYIETNDLQEVISAALDDLQAGRAPLAEVRLAIRRAVLRGTWPADTAAAIRAAYQELCQRIGHVAGRWSRLRSIDAGGKARVPYQTFAAFAGLQWNDGVFAALAWPRRNVCNRTYLSTP
jgi:phosphoenolpyruvate synthase/pyruvate phosphate dikinase